MQFNIKGVKIKISFTFFAVYLIFIGYSEGKVFLYCILTAILHELVHLFFLIAFGGKIKEISFSGAGGNIKRSDNLILSDSKEAIISLSAPFFNILIGFVIILIFPDSDFAKINLIMGLFNILPFYSFDGGRAIEFILSHVINAKLINIILTVLSVLVTVLVGCLSVTVLMANDNPLLLITAGFMLISLIFNAYKYL